LIHSWLQNISPQLANVIYAAQMRQTSMTGLPYAISCSAALSLLMVYSDVYLVRLMVESHAQHA